MGTATLELLLKLHDDPDPWDDLWHSVAVEYGIEEHVADGGPSTIDPVRIRVARQTSCRCGQSWTAHRKGAEPTGTQLQYPK
jgi:hypothetical protein